MGHASQRSIERYTQPQPGTRLVVTEATATPAETSVEDLVQQDPEVEASRTTEAGTDVYDQYIDFDIPGLAKMRQHILETLDDARSCETKFLAPAAEGIINTERLDGYLSQLTDAYELLQTMLRQAEAQLHGTHVSVEEYISDTTIQEQYNVFIGAYDKVATEVSKLTALLVEAQHPAVTDQDVSTPERVAVDTLPKHTPIDDAERVPVAHGHALSVFVTEADRLCAKYQHSLSLWEATFSGDIPQDVAIYLAEYQHAHERLRHIHDTARALDRDDDDTVSAAQLEIYTRVQHEIEVNIATLESALRAYQKKAESDKKEHSDDGPKLPDRSGVEQLIDRIKLSATASEEEKQTAMSLLENYDRLLNENAEASRLQVMYESVQSFVDGILDDHLVPDLQQTFIEKYQHLLKIPSLLPDHAMTLRAMKTQFDQLSTENPINIASLQQLVTNLTQYETDHQTELVRVFGMRLPVAGTPGVFGARSFREALEIQLHDKRIKDNPEAKAILKKMLKIVGFVPEEGILPDEVMQLHQLATQLNATIETTRVPEAYPLPDVAVHIPHQSESGSRTLTLELSQITINPLPTSVPDTQIMSSIVTVATRQLTEKPYSTSEEVSEVATKELSKVTGTPTAVTVGAITLVVQDSVPTVDEVQSAPAPENPVTSIENSPVPVHTFVTKHTAPQPTTESVVSAPTTERVGSEDVVAEATVEESTTGPDRPRTHESTSQEFLKILTSMPKQPDGQYMQDSEIQKYITEWYGNSAVFAKKVERHAATYEAKNYDWVEENTKEFQSMYAYLRTMTVGDIEVLRHRNRDELRQILSEHELKYEALVSDDGWYEMVLRMQDVLPYQEATTLEDLWQRWNVYTEVAKRTQSSNYTQV